MSSLFSIIIPVFNNAASLPELVHQLNEIQASLNGSLEVVFVIDGSRDNSLLVLRHLLPKSSFSSKVCVHSRNFGSWAAIRTGLAEASGDYFAFIAADLQQPPELTLSFFKSLSEDEADIVIGIRSERDDPVFSKIFSLLFWRLYRLFIIPEMPVGGLDVFGCSRQVKDILLQLEERNPFIQALILWVGFRRVFIPYHRLARKHGKSEWTFRAKLDLLSNSIYSFTDFPIQLLKWVGSFACSFAVIWGIIILASRLLGHVQIPGYATIILTIMFFGGLNMLGLGIVGEYAWRAFENTQKRPFAIVSSRESFHYDPAQIH